MSQRFEKLKGLLKELFQLDQPDLDFGIYRVLHAKSAEVSQFLDDDLLPQVQAAFAQYRSADKAELEKELSEVIVGIEAAGMNPDDSPKVKELRIRLKSDAVDIAALESEVYTTTCSTSFAATTPRATSSPSASTHADAFSNIRPRSRHPTPRLAPRAPLPRRPPAPAVPRSSGCPGASRARS